MTVNNKTQSMPRRDFLAGLGGLATTTLLVGCSLPPPVLAALRKLEKAPKGAAIDHLGIYPPIGISRVGLSEETFAAPEVPGIAPNPPGGFKVGNEQLKRQVQRFFIFAFDAQGRVIREIKHSEGDQISWTVHVANSKAAWFGFTNPFNLERLSPHSAAPGISAKLRNDDIKDDADRAERLIIDSGVVTISGKQLNSDGKNPQHALKGHFWTDDHEVHLGALQTDKEGRLRVKPASGVSKSVIANNPIVDFTKNDAWYDDWCDGPVKASVVIGGKTYAARTAWVACCGPNFAPEIPPFTSMHDTIADAMVTKYENLPPKLQLYQRPSLPLSFSKDIYPIFYRLGLMQWVSSASNTRQGWIKVGDFSSVAYIKQLANLRDPKSKILRHEVFEQFHNPQSKVPQQFKLPYMLGSGVDYASSPQHWFNMPALQYWILQQWRDGHYTNDFSGNPVEQCRDIEACELADRPELLTRAALEPLSGGNFHPGVELTWVLGEGDLFEDNEPFRLKLGNRDSLIQDIGPLITVDKVFPPKAGKYNPNDYPIGPQMPGDLTRWMGLPWQPDAFSCQNVNYANDFPTVVWWPALLPVDVMPEFAYKQLFRKDLSTEERLKFATVRVPWARGAAGIGYHANAGYFDGLNRMVYLVDHMGMVVRKPAPADLKDENGKVLNDLYVETDRGSMDLEFNEQPCTGLPNNDPNCGDEQYYKITR